MDIHLSANCAVREIPPSDSAHDISLTLVPVLRLDSFEYVKGKALRLCRLDNRKVVGDAS